MRADRALEKMQETRRRNLKVLSKEGPDAELARRMGYSRTTVSLWLSGARPLTEKAARKIEEKLRLASGWLDVRHIKGE